MIRYSIGDATQPQGEGPFIIAHVSNNLGGWKLGFVGSLSKRWREPEAYYRKCHRDNGLTLGEVQFVPVDLGNKLGLIFVANMMAQKGYGYNNSQKHRGAESDSAIPLQYDALEVCLSKVADFAQKKKASVVMPRVGCGLAGSTWDKVEPIIHNTLCAAGVGVTVYDFPGSTFNP